MKAKQPRIAEIQVLRGFAFLAVVLQHAIGHYAYVPEAGIADGAMLAIALIASKFAVPMFIFITGLVLFYNYQERVHASSFIRKRCKDIVLPYLIWSAIYEIAFREDGIPLGQELQRIYEYVLTGTASYHLWYVIMVIQLYLLFPLIQQWVLRIWAACSARQLTAGLIVLTIGYIWLTGMQGTISNAVIAWNLPVLTPLFSEYADRNALYFYIYFVMGIVAGLNMNRWKQVLLKWKTLGISLYMLVACVLFYTIVSHFQVNGKIIIQYNDTLLVQPFMAVFLMISVVAMYIAALAFQERASERFKRFFNFLGHYSYGAYLAHALMLTAATFVTDRYLPGWNVSLRTLVAFIVCTLLSVFVAQLLSRFPLGRLMTGTPVMKKI
ncbi:acyltransferase [Paenibacillus periandrae]|uniref:acyltransferase n=1 Tax=Paenibacillus periandrae TaxID=1761741 RepID=UPI001F09B425|nr:acyltransferase [Paenibacillus periandrae]